MQADDLRAVMVRDLRALAREVAAYPDDESPWRPVPGIANGGGTLARHAALAAEIAEAIAELERVMPSLSAERMAAEFPVEVGGHRFVTARWLTHLASHLGYHLGQVDYHRRMVAPASGTVGTMSVAEL